MYPTTCRGSTSGVVRLFKGSSRLGQTSISSSNGFGYVSSRLGAGTYTVQVSISRNSHSGAVNDFTARVYAAESVALKDASGRTSTDTRITFTDGSTAPLEGSSTTTTTTTTTNTNT